MSASVVRNPKRAEFTVTVIGSETLQTECNEAALRYLHDDITRLLGLEAPEAPKPVKPPLLVQVGCLTVYGDYVAVTNNFRPCSDPKHTPVYKKL